MLVLKVNAPLLVIGRSSPPLSWRTSPLPLKPITDPPIVNGPAAEPEPDPEPEPEPEPEPDPEPEPEPEPEPVPDVFKPLHAESINDRIIRNRSDFWLGFMVCLISSLFAYRGCKVAADLSRTAKGNWFGRSVTSIESGTPKRKLRNAHTERARGNVLAVPCCFNG
jgi:hypothetical protein